MEVFLPGFRFDQRLKPFGVPDPNTRQTFVKGAKLYKKAKLTDLLSGAAISHHCMLMSKELFTLMKTFNCMPFEVVDCEIEHENQMYLYNYVYFPEKQLQFIDFKRSRFCELRNGGWTRNLIIGGYEKLIQKLAEEVERNANAASKDHTNIYILQLFFDQDKTNLDLFAFFRLGITWFIVSARLKEAIEAAKLSGMDFEPADGYLRYITDKTFNPPRQVM